ncbi:MAG: DNA polymerase IV [Puniceicoccales bacterium]|nr:DNA polymerase IV [Puniceicoccales bacterium]
MELLCAVHLKNPVAAENFMDHAQMEFNPRKILHVDMDAFFAAVERLDNPKLDGKPIIVGGSPWGRSVVSTCSYEARKFGVHSSMPSRKAMELCPHAIFLPCRMERYGAVSKDIFAILRGISKRIEPLSIDEAFMDVTDNELCEQSATRVAVAVRKRIRSELGLSCSVGVSYNRFLAKIASEMAKPDGIYVIEPKFAKSFIGTLPIGKFYGIGRATAKRLEARQIFTGADLLSLSEEELVEMFGKNGRRFYDLVRGVDTTPVRWESARRKSLSRERTFDEDLMAICDVEGALYELAKEIEMALGAEHMTGRTITVKLRYDNFETVSMSRTFPSPQTSSGDIASAARNLLREKTAANFRPIRLLGIAISSLAPIGIENIQQKKFIQMELPLVFALAH